MRIRYCLTALGKIIPCCVGWGEISSNTIKTCQDEPMEENCHYIVEERDKNESMLNK